MSIQTQIDRLAANVSNTLSAIKSKGVAVPADATSDDMAGLVRQINADPDMAASDVSFTPPSGMTATDVQAAIEELHSDVNISSVTTLMTGITSIAVQTIDASAYKKLMIRMTFAGGNQCDQVIDCSMLSLLGEMTVAFTNGLPDSSAYYGMALVKVTPTSVQLISKMNGTSITAVRYSVRGFN